MAILQWDSEGPLSPWNDLYAFYTPYTGAEVAVFCFIAEAPGFWRCTVGGTSGSVEPTWTPPGPITDGTVTWGSVVPTWQPATAYVSGDAVIPTVPNGHLYTVQVAGTSGNNEPLWRTDGPLTPDPEGEGSLVDPDATDNEDGTGTIGGAVESVCLFQVWENPALDRNAAPIGTLTKASDRQVRVVFNNAGEGSFTINRHDDEAAWLMQDRIVVVYRESLTNAPFFAFILEEATVVAVSEDEDGGDTVRWSGRGVMALLERAILYHESYLPNAADLGALPQSDRDGMWHWTDRPPAAILVRQLEEARYRGTEFGAGIQDSAIPNVYWTFTRHKDSTNVSWDNSAGALFKLPVGDNLFGDVLPKLMQVGLLLGATPVINADDHLRTKLSAWTDDPGVSTGIVFEKGVNIAEAGEKQIEAFVGYTDVLVQGDAVVPAGYTGATYVYAVRDDDTFRDDVGRREGFLPFQATPTAALLNKAGDRLIRQGKRRHGGPTTLEVTERTDEVAFVDYFPGDYVTVNIPGVWDNYTDNVDEILMAEQDNGTFSVGIQFASDDPIGVVGISVDNCACSVEPEGET